MGHNTGTNVLAIAQQTELYDGYTYTIAGVRSTGWTERSKRLYTVVWVVQTGDGSNMDNQYFGLSGTIDNARKAAKAYEKETDNKAVFHAIHETV